MPGYDRSGPMGEGPMTGRGLGRCGRGRMSRPGSGGGYGGYGMRGIRRRGRWFEGADFRWDTPGAATETERMKQYAEELEAELSAVRRSLGQRAEKKGDSEN
jgi:hypothetical protein